MAKNHKLDRLSDKVYNVDMHTTIRVWKKTLYLLRRVHVETNESMVEILHRLIDAEFKRVCVEKEKHV